MGNIEYDETKQCLNGVNIYFNVYEIGGKQIEYLDDNGKIVDVITYQVKKDEPAKISKKIKNR